MLNETVHPDTRPLVDALINCKRFTDEGDVYYVPLQQWSEGQGKSDDAMADLYALIEESCSPGMTQAVMSSAVSKALWINQQRFPRG
jgi:hypothetical protein